MFHVPVVFPMRGCLSLLNSLSPRHKTPLKTPCVASSIFQLSALPRTDLPRFRCHGMPPCSELQSAGSRMSRSAVRDTQMTQQQCGCGKILHCEQLQWTVRGLRLQMPLCLLKFWPFQGQQPNLKPHKSATNQPIPFRWNTSNRAHPFALGICFFSSPRLSLADENGEQLLPEAHHLLKISSAEGNQADLYLQVIMP